MYPITDVRIGAAEIDQWAILPDHEVDQGKPISSTLIRGKNSN